MSVPTGTVHHDTSTLALVVVLLLSGGMQQSTKGVAHKVVERCLLARKQLVLLQCASFLLDCFLDGSWLCLTALLGSLAGHAQWSLGQVCCHRL